MATLGDSIFAPEPVPRSRNEMLMPWLKLHGPSSDVCKEFKGPEICRAQIRQHDGRMIPDKIDASNNGLNLNFGIRGGSIAKHIYLHITVGGSNLRKSHRSVLEFYPGIGGHVKNFTFSKMSGARHQETAPSEKPYLVEWITTGGVGTGLNNFHDEFNVRTTSELESIASYLQDEASSPRTISIVVQVREGLFKSLVSLRDHTSPALPWEPYLVNNGFPHKWSELQRMRNAIEKSAGGLCQFPARNFFISKEEAFVKLAFGTFYEYYYAPTEGLRDAWRLRGANDQNWIDVQLRALRLLFLADSKCVRQWQATFINQRPTSQPRTDPARELTFSSTVENALHHLVSCYSWDDDQIRALKSSRAVSGGLGIVEGPPGSGKTHILAGMAAFYHACGSCVLLLAPSASAAEALSAALDAILTQLQRCSPIASPLPIVINLWGKCPDLAAYKAGHLRVSMAQARLVVTTPNIVCSRDFCENFGTNSESTIIIHDDSHLCLESETLTTVFALRHYQKVEALILATDVREWPIAVVTKIDLEQQEEGDDYPTNEFANQVALPLVTRLLRQRFPAVRLQRQHRMKPALTKFPIDRIYRSLLSSAPATYVRPLCKEFLDSLRQWLKEPKDLYAEGVSVMLLYTTGKGTVEQGKTKSRRNAQNAKTVIDLLKTVIQGRNVLPSDIAVITPYKDQVRLYEQTIQHVAEREGLEVSDFPQAYTIDSLRGKEKRIVIFDVVVTDEARSRGVPNLGIVADEFKVNVACTRACDMFIMVGHPSMMSTRFSQDQKTTQAAASREDSPQKPLPYVLEYADYLEMQGLVYYDPYVNWSGVEFKDLERAPKGAYSPFWERKEFNTAGFDQNIERDQGLMHQRAGHIGGNRNIQHKDVVRRTLHLKVEKI